MERSRTVRKWSRPMPMTLTYAFLPTKPVSEEYKLAFKCGFARWSVVMPIDFVEVQNVSLADIRIGSFHNPPACGQTFSDQTLAHAHPPGDGRICLNEDLMEEINYDFDMEFIATHEIGHVLGLDHSEDENSIMYEAEPPKDHERTPGNLDKSDVIQIQKLYRSELYTSELRSFPSRLSGHGEGVGKHCTCCPFGKFKKSMKRIIE